MEKEYKGLSGYLFAFIELVLLVLIVFGFMRGFYIPSAVMIFLLCADSTGVYGCRPESELS
jgi:hypothetical protein